MNKNFNKPQQGNTGNQQNQQNYGNSNAGSRETPLRNPRQGNQEQTGKSYKETGLGQGQEKKPGQQTGQRGPKENRESLRPHGFPNQQGQQSKEKQTGQNLNQGQKWEGAGAEQEENIRGGRNRGEQLPPAGHGGNEFEEDDEIRAKKRIAGDEDEDENLGNRI